MNPSFKIKINLSDYDYRKELAIRELLSQLSLFEMEALREILDNSLEFTLESLADILSVPTAQVDSVIQKLQKAGLLSQQRGKICVDKEMRKSFELHLPRFTEEYSPSLTTFFQELKAKLSLHQLPNWYFTSRVADDLLSGIVEKFLFTPELYRKYLLELMGVESWMNPYIQHVLETPLQELEVPNLQEKFLLLEYHLVAFPVWERRDGVMKIFLRPLAEWEELQRALQKALPQRTSVKRAVTEFGFLRQEHPTISDYESFALSLYQQQQDSQRRLVEKSLRMVSELGWIEFQAYFQSFLAPIGTTAPIALKKQGGRFRYQLPQYNLAERQYVYDTIFTVLYQMGIVDTFQEGERSYFSVTEFGKSII